MNLILLGAPGAGKGTQAELLHEKLKLAHVATGDLFRQAVANGTELGKEAKVYMAQGKLVPNEITIKMVMERLNAPDVKAGVILDGFPRNVEQAKALDEALKKQKKTIDKVIYIKVDEEEVIRRLGGRLVCRNCESPYHAVASPPRVKDICDKCGGELYQRPDDNPETIKKRLATFRAETAPLVDYYSKAGKLLEILSAGGIEAVNQKIIAALEKKG